MAPKFLLLALGSAALTGAGYAAGSAVPAAKGYIISEITVTDPATYETYKPKAGALVAQYGGRYLVRGGAAYPSEGAPPTGRVIVLEFGSISAARAFEQSAEYREVAKIRQRSATTRAFIVEGRAP